MAAVLAPAWRIAWLPLRGDHWRLSLYEHRHLKDAKELRTLLVRLGYAQRAELIPCQTQMTDHGVDSRWQGDMTSS